MPTVAFMVGHITPRMVLWGSLSSRAASLLPDPGLLLGRTCCAPQSNWLSSWPFVTLPQPVFLLDFLGVLVTSPCVPQTPGTPSQRPHGSLEVPSLA